ncbi:HAMP domain-containing sensor histidine kinase [Actinoallomurus soli]|uniref:HAMP domain-containing sensor histidine kinase n=1 Tax=Actinoallomurus soli TaxID=2952535 RepID=UPI002093D190|nr:HAMP domain-containing sensor histidine kinase [Actinoallomurus soli]MCO5966860.1 HAMP domain-containing histidine kinase [Actinoallomurus soli]
MSLRTRLAVLTSLAVAVAVAACAIGCWFIVRRQLVEQLDQSLSSPKAGFGGGPPGGGQGGPLRRETNPVSDICTQPPRGGNDRFRDFLPTMQVVRADGTTCSPQDTTDPLVPAKSDVQVAEGLRDLVRRDGRTRSGTPMRIFTHRDPNSGVAVSIAKPLDPVNEKLDSLAVLLVVVSAVGVLGAATAGLLVARAGLRPVDRLTAAVEHIARTEDLATTIPADGHDEIARLSRSFNSMTRALASARERQQQLIVDAGHELRTPLTSLRTNIDLMLRSETTGRPLPAAHKQKLLGNVKEQLVELTHLVGDLLDLSRPQPAAGARVEEDVAVHEAVASALRRARLRGPGLRVEEDVSPWYVRGDAASLERAVVNLLDNAVKFSPPDGTVTVRLAGGELTVRDQGPGIPPEDLPHVFDRFWRSPSARGLPGSGLGLAIVARAVADAGGEVRLGPAEGGGTLAWLRLPGSATPPQGAELGRDEPRVGVADAGGRAGGEDAGGRG